jgi:hypothetical protein
VVRRLRAERKKGGPLFWFACQKPKMHPSLLLSGSKTGRRRSDKKRVGREDGPSSSVNRQPSALLLGREKSWFSNESVPCRMDKGMAGVTTREDLTREERTGQEGKARKGGRSGARPATFLSEPASKGGAVFFRQPPPAHRLGFARSRVRGVQQGVSPARKTEVTREPSAGEAEGPSPCRTPLAPSEWAAEGESRER